MTLGKFEFIRDAVLIDIGLAAVGEIGRDIILVQHAVTVQIGEIRVTKFG